jgi:hypothetical protein
MIESEKQGGGSPLRSADHDRRLALAWKALHEERKRIAPLQQGSRTGHTSIKEARLINLIASLRGE